MNHPISVRFTQVIDRTCICGDGPRFEALLDSVQAASRL
jgi:hypothetical protein